MKEHEKDLKEVNQSGEDFLHEAKVCSFNIHNHNSVVLLHAFDHRFRDNDELCVIFTWKPKYLNLCVFGCVCVF